jgi:hypothetical protein
MAVDIPISVITIEQEAFGNCRNLKDITIHWLTPLSVPFTIFQNATLSAVNLHVPAGTEDLYKADPVWRNFNIISAENI